jgi:hypothetical protein
LLTACSLCLQGQAALVHCDCALGVLCSSPRPVPFLLVLLFDMTGFGARPHAQLVLARMWWVLLAGMLWLACCEAVACVAAPYERACSCSSWWGMLCSFSRIALLDMGQGSLGGHLKPQIPIHTCTQRRCTSMQPYPAVCFCPAKARSCCCCVSWACRPTAAIALTAWVVMYVLFPACVMHA